MKEYKKFALIEIEGEEILILEKVPGEFISGEKGKIVFTPKEIQKHAEFMVQLLGGQKHINFNVEILVLDYDFFVVSTNMKLKPDQIQKNITRSLFKAQQNAKLILDNSGYGHKKTIFLPGDLARDPERTKPPEVIAGKLHIKNHFEVQGLMTLQNELLKRDLMIDGDIYNKIPKDSNLFLAREDSSECDNQLDFRIQSIDFSKRNPVFKFSRVDTEKKEKPFEVKISENLKESPKLFELVDHLKVSPEERASFSAICDVVKIYDEAKDEVKITSITLRELV